MAGTVCPCRPAFAPAVAAFVELVGYRDGLAQAVLIGAQLYIDLDTEHLHAYAWVEYHQDRQKHPPSHPPIAQFDL